MLLLSPEIKHIVALNWTLSMLLLLPEIKNMFSLFVDFVGIH